MCVADNDYQKEFLIEEYEINKNVIEKSQEVYEFTHGTKILLKIEGQIISYRIY